MTKIEDRYWIETDSFVHSSIPKEATPQNGITGTSYPYIRAPHLKLHIIPVFHVSKNFPTRILFVENLNLYILPNTLTFLSLRPKYLTCIQDNPILLL